MKSGMLIQNVMYIVSLFGMRMLFCSVKFFLCWVQHVCAATRCSGHRQIDAAAGIFVMVRPFICRHCLHTGC